MKFETIDELLSYTKNIIGKTFKELDTDGRLNNGIADKGILGKIVETGFYHYPNNNMAQADFENLGVELKVTGYVKNKNGTISAKERLVLSKINYNDIINEEFDFSKLIFKNKKILIIWYEYDYTKNVKDFVITNYQLYDMSDDALIIKNDFEIIKEKVVEGKAHLLSEGDTSFLGACVKGVNGEEKISQPNSQYLAKPRAFSLKHSYLTGILRNLDVTLDVDNQEYKTVEQYVFAQIKKFIGKTQIDIYTEIMEQTISGNIPKNIGKIISDKLIGTDEELPEKNPLFAKTNYKIKNIPIDSNFMPYCSIGIIHSLSPSLRACGCAFSTANIFGIDGPKISASSKPTLYPCFAKAIARFALTVDFPTPPLPEATANTFLTFEMPPSPAKSFALIISICTSTVPTDGMLRFTAS